MMLMLQPLRRITNVNATLQRGIAAGEMTIKVGRPVIRPGPGVDTEEDLLVAQRLLEQPPSSFQRCCFAPAFRMQLSQPALVRDIGNQSKCTIHFHSS